MFLFLFLIILGVILAILAVALVITAFDEDEFAPFMAGVLVAFLGILCWMGADSISENNESEKKQSKPKTVINAQDRIDKLKQELASARDEQKKCTHQWSEAVSDPETVKRAVFTGEYEVNGIHRWPITTYVDDQKPRWSRACKTCGFKEYTYKQGAKLVQTGPQFD